VGYLPYQCGMWNWYDSFGWGWALEWVAAIPGGLAVATMVPTSGAGMGVSSTVASSPAQTSTWRRGHCLIAVNRHTVAPIVTLPSRDKTSVVNIVDTPCSRCIRWVASGLRSLGSGFVNRTVLANGTVITNAGGVPATGNYAYRRPTFGTARTGSAAAASARSASGGAHTSSAGVIGKPCIEQRAPAASHASSGGGDLAAAVEALHTQVVVAAVGGGSHH